MEGPANGGSLFVSCAFDLGGLGVDGVQAFGLRSSFKLIRGTFVVASLGSLVSEVSSSVLG